MLKGQRFMKSVLGILLHKTGIVTDLIQIVVRGTMGQLPRVLL